MKKTFIAENLLYGPAGLCDWEIQPGANRSAFFSILYTTDDDEPGVYRCIRW